MNANASPPLILIADDDSEILEMLEEHFQDYHCRILTARDGLTALNTAREHKPDLIILDVMMPRMNGWEVCKLIKSNPEFVDTGVIILTAIGQNLTELTAELFGADDRIDKPFTFSELDFKVRRVIAERRRLKRHRESMTTRSGTDN